MARTDLTTLSVGQLEGELKKRRTVQYTVAAIFGVIIAAWIVLGFWRENLPVFISTVVMGGAATVAVSAASQGIAAELKRRAGSAPRA